MWAVFLCIVTEGAGFEARSDVSLEDDTARAGARRETAQAVSRLTGG